MNFVFFNWQQHYLALSSCATSSSWFRVFNPISAISRIWLCDKLSCRRLIKSHADPEGKDHINYCLRLKRWKISYYILHWHFDNESCFVMVFFFMSETSENFSPFNIIVSKSQYILNMLNECFLKSCKQKNSCYDKNFYLKARTTNC